jgi:hypothetical protein
MATLDEISKEKQRVTEALARVDAQREKLAGQLGELGRLSVCWRATAKACPQERWPRPGRRSWQQRRVLHHGQAGASA